MKYHRILHCLGKCDQKYMDQSEREQFWWIEILTNICWHLIYRLSVFIDFYSPRKFGMIALLEGLAFQFMLCNFHWLTHLANQDLNCVFGKNCPLAHTNSFVPPSCWVISVLTQCGITWKQQSPQLSWVISSYSCFSKWSSSDCQCFNIRSPQL